MSRFSSLLCGLLFCMITYAQEITVSFKSLIHWTPFINFSSEIRPPADTAGKLPHLWLAPNLEEPSPCIHNQCQSDNSVGNEYTEVLTDRSVTKQVLSCGWSYDEK